MNDELKTVKTNIGIIPIEDYLEICALQYGYDSYAELREDGYYIEIPDSGKLIKSWQFKPL